MNTNPPVSGDSPTRRVPETFRARSLFVSLTVSDLQKSLHWYMNVAGFTLIEKFEHDGRLAAANLVAGAVRIRLNQDNGARDLDRARGRGMSLQFTTAQNVDEIARRIQAHGGTLDTEPADMPWGVRLFSVLDPDGFVLVIVSDPDVERSRWQIAREQQG